MRQEETNCCDRLRLSPHKNAIDGEISTAGNYERETISMLEKAFDEAVVLDGEKAQEFNSDEIER